MSKIHDAWTAHLRKRSRQQGPGAEGVGGGDDSQPGPPRLLKCPSCNISFHPNINIDHFREHVQADAAKHGSLETDSAVTKAFEQMTLETGPSLSTSRPAGSPSPSMARKRPVSGTSRDDTAQPEGAFAPPDDDEPEPKKLRSPPASDIQQRGSSPTNSTPGRSRARPPIDDFDRGPQRRPASGRQLFNPDSDPVRQKTHQRNRGGARGGRIHHQPRPPPAPAETSDSAPIPVDPDHPNTSLVPQLETKAISHEQLVAEVKGIYTGLVMIESKCIEVDTAQSQNTDHQLSPEQWQALIALHRTLLHEHHDFFLASQHPVASDALKRLAAKYAMPARMWRHGIHSFLELLRHRLPHSYHQMLTFIYLAYGMMALLYETVSSFRDVWVECLGDLARYRMAIEETDVKDRETWTNVARSWYCKASDKAPTTGRLYHHLAILARPKAVQQLYFYVKSLCVPIPFPTAKESIMSLFDPLFQEDAPSLAPIDAAFVRVHAILFSGKHEERLDASINEFLGLLDTEIGRLTKRWLEIGYYTGIPLACALMGYGAEDHFLTKTISQRPEEVEALEEGAAEVQPDEKFEKARTFMTSSYEIAIRRWGDPNTLPFLHTILAFIMHCSRYPTVMVHLENQFPWKLTAVMLNYLYHSCKFELRIDSEEFPGPYRSDTPRPLPEDYAMRGLIYTEEYYPISWFRDSKVEEDEKYFELASMTDARKERLLWIGRRLAASGKWLTWDGEERKFGVAEPYSAGADDVAL